MTQRNPSPGFHVEAGMEKQEIKWAKVAPYYQGKVKVLTNDGIEFTPVFFWQSGMAWDGDRRQEPAGKYKPILRALEDMTDQRRLQVLEEREWWAFERDHEQARLITRDDPRWDGNCVKWEVFRHGGWLEGTISLTNDHIGNVIKYINEGFDVFGLIESGQAIRKEVKS